MQLDPRQYPEHFAAVGASTPGPFLFTEQFDVDRWPADWIESRPYVDQRQHVSEYAAFYPRKFPSARTGLMYNRFKNPSCVLWMAEAVGVDKMLLRRGVVRMLELARENRGGMAREAVAFRRIVPWEALFERIPAWVERTPIAPELREEVSTMLSLDNALPASRTLGV